MCRLPSPPLPAASLTSSSGKGPVPRGLFLSCCVVVLPSLPLAWELLAGVDRRFPDHQKVYRKLNEALVPGYHCVSAVSSSVGIVSASLKRRSRRRRIRRADPAPALSTLLSAPRPIIRQRISRHLVHQSRPAIRSDRILRPKTHTNQARRRPQTSHLGPR